MCQEHLQVLGILLHRKAFFAVNQPPSSNANPAQGGACEAGHYTLFLMLIQVMFQAF